ncbi:septum formation initiator family protein [Nocardioides maradonensis]
MADPRRTSRKPGRPAKGRTSPAAAARSAEAVARRDAQREKVAARAKAVAEEKHRTRLTGRAAILVLVLAALAVSYASSLRAYLAQRSQTDQTLSHINAVTGSITESQREIERWKDPAYVAQQAKSRFGYVARGETPYVVVDGNGRPLDGTSQLSDPATVGKASTPTWYSTAWASMKVAGDPPTTIPAPQDGTITAPKGSTAQ